MMAASFVRRLPIDFLRAQRRIEMQCQYVSVPVRLQSAVAASQYKIHNSSNQKHVVDPFGLQDPDETDLSMVVQGLYSSHNQPQTGDVVGDNKAQFNSDPHRTSRNQLYASWLEEQKISRRRAKLDDQPGSELARSAPFGSIRFDNDNVPWEGGEEDYGDDVVEQNSVDLLEVESPTPVSSFGGFSIKKQNSGSTENPKPPPKAKPSEQTKAQPTMNPKIAAILNKNKVQPPAEPVAPAIASAVIPAIYQMPCLNHLTRAEMWNLVRESVVFQNEFLIAINKPYGLPIHTPTHDCRHTMIDFLDELTTFSNSKEQVFPLHRLDKETTGVLLFAKSQMASTVIKGLFATQQIHKKYLVITKNCPPLRSGTIDIPIGEGKVAGTDTYRAVLKPNLRKFKIANSQNGCKEAVTRFQVISSRESCSFIEARPVTGVKHQIRIHLGMGLGCPILGDHKYSHREKLAPQRLSPTVLTRLNMKQSKVRHIPLHLHCSTIEFNMPPGFGQNDEPVFTYCRPPKHFMYTLRQLNLK